MIDWMMRSSPWNSWDCLLWGNMPFPIFQAAVNEITDATQAPIKMVSHCAVNAVFTSVQGLADFERPDGGSSPLTNISLIVGETGERKSTVDRPLFREIRKFRESINDGAHRAEVEYTVREKTWAIQQKILDKRLTASINEDGSVNEQLMAALIEHGLRRPQRPLTSQFVYEDTSLASLKRGLANFPCACVHSSEGMSILDGPLFEEKNLLCTLYSGDTYFFDRANESKVLRGRRICVSAHSQPKRTLRFLAKNGDEFRDSGLAARMTLCIARSTQGSRTYDALPASTTSCDQFNDRVRYLLQVTARSAKKVGFRRRLIKFDQYAAHEFLQYSRDIEREMRPGGRFAFAKDYANRLAEKVGRLSAAIHLFEDFEGDISLNTYRAARSFYDEESDDFLYLFTYVPSEQYLADQLLSWLQQHRVKLGEPGIKRSYVAQRCLVSLRKKVVLDPVLTLLEQQGKVHLRVINKTTYVCLGFAAATASQLAAM
ncbi:MAG: DUF3987 domain-containing protein [Rhodanobacter sp.]